MFEPTARIARSPGVRSATVKDEKVLLHLGRGQYYALSASAAVLWDELASPQEFGFLVSTLIRVFDVEESNARLDLEALLAEMVDEELVLVEGA